MSTEIKWGDSEGTETVRIIGPNVLSLTISFQITKETEFLDINGERFVRWSDLERKHQHAIIDKFGFK